MQAFSSRLISTSKEDIPVWRALVKKNPKADIFFTPEYSLTFAGTTGETKRNFGGEALLFFYGNEDNYIVYPFFKRRISELPFHRHIPPRSNDWFDIISPYGYSGPLAYVTDLILENQLWQEFFSAFHEECIKDKVVAEFVRLHPFIRNHVPVQTCPDIEVRKRPAVIYMDLTLDETAMRKEMSKGNKSSVSKARRNGVEIRCSATPEEIDAFYRLYIATMERNNAKNAYFFSRDFFTTTFQLLGENVRLYSAWYKDKIIAASLFIYQGEFAHYYLSGSDAAYLSLCPNNLLMYEVISSAKASGFKIFNLGGGYVSGDSLYNFKASFSKATADFYIYNRIHNKEVYDILCHARDEYDKLAGKEPVKSDYFPGYRR
jgi:hypothetical protein